MYIFSKDIISNNFSGVTILMFLFLEITNFVIHYQQKINTKPLLINYKNINVNEAINQ